MACSKQDKNLKSTIPDKRCMEFKCIDEVHVVVTESDLFKELINRKSEYVVLHSEGESHEVHPKILGMVSKYFNSYFKWHKYVREVNLEEEKDPVKDCESISCVVHYANTGVLRFSSLNVEKLYKIGHYLLCPFVKEECENVIIKIMQNKDASEILSMMTLGDKFQSPKILKAVCEYVSENFLQLSTKLLQLCEKDFELLFSNKYLSVFRHGIPVDDPDFVLQNLVTTYNKRKENVRLQGSLTQCINEKYFSKCKRNIEFGDESYGLSAKVLLKYSDFEGGIVTDHVCSEMNRDVNDRLKTISLWYVEWDGGAVLGGMIIVYKSGTKIEYNTKPKKIISESEFSLDEDEVLINVDLYLGCFVKDLSFKTNFGRDIGPFSIQRIEPWEFQRHEMSRGEHSYLHSLRCKIVQLRYGSAISCLNFAWITYPCDEFKGKSVWKNVSEDDYIVKRESVETQLRSSALTFPLHQEMYTTEQRRFEGIPMCYMNNIKANSMYNV